MVVGAPEPAVEVVVVSEEVVVDVVIESGKLF
jgi:hypothetical protein